jgi:phenylpropionate dioxygenase-like ring-hydroxylating dioxygenase large terminal subunit
MQIARICIFLVPFTNTVHGFLFPILNRVFGKERQFDTEVSKTVSSVNSQTLYQRLYDAKWYVIGTPTDFSVTRPTKTTIWSTDYVVWKTGPTTYAALSNGCPHRGASFSDGTITPDSCIMCPYHGYTYDEDGTLTHVPGVQITPSNYVKSYDAARYDVVEDGGWVYLNTFPYRVYNVTPGSLSNNLAEDVERMNEFRCNMMQLDYNASPRLLTENGLDISHIGFVHSFGNRDSPNPIEENPPRQIAPNRFQTKYKYEAGPKSMAKVVFGEEVLRVENEFVLPHMSIARVKFDVYVNTIVTFATPISHNKTRLYVKNYRNFWRNFIGDWIIRATMWQTMREDRKIVEGIYEDAKDGKFNMRYDKLANTYRVLYEKEYGPQTKK